MTAFCCVFIITEENFKFFVIFLCNFIYHVMHNILVVVGGSFTADAPKTVSYADAVSNQPLMMVAEDTATYGTKKDGE